MPPFVLLLERQLKRYQDGPTWENRFNTHKAIRLPNRTPLTAQFIEFYRQYSRRPFRYNPSSCA